MKTKTWQRTWLEWKNHGQQQTDWKTNLEPVKPSHKGEVYWMKRTRAIQAPDHYTLIEFDVIGQPDSRCREEILNRIHMISEGRKFLRVSTDYNLGFRVSFRLKGSFCDEVLDFMTDLMRVCGIDLHWLGDFNSGTETYYYYEYGGCIGYISHNQFFKIQRGLLDPSKRGLIYIGNPDLDPLK